MLTRSIVASLLLVAGSSHAASGGGLAALQEAVKADPADASSLLRLGLYLRAEGRTDEGDAWIKAAHAADPAFVADALLSDVAARGVPGCAVTGPDIIVADLHNAILINHSGPDQDGVSAFGVGTTACNIGTVGVLFQAATPNHPVTAQNLYRYADGRFSQLGLSWLAHGFFALSSNFCCTCMGPGGAELSPGCSDVTTASLNASANILGPRFEVNAATGAFPYPYTSPPITSNLDRRLQVADADIDPARNPGARWFFETQYIAPDDAAAGNDLNNASHREFAFSAAGAGFAASPVAPVTRGEPAILAWTVLDPGAVVNPVDVPDDGRFYVGSSVIDNGDGTWRYEYAVHNLNSDRSAQSFAVAVSAGVTITGAGFSGVAYHSGEPFDGADWAFSRSGSEARWETDAFDVNPNANALRWGTLYNFWFTADAAPADADATLGLFKPSPYRSGAATTTVAAPAGACPADLNGSASVGAEDLAQLLASWGAAGDADFDESGAVGPGDLAILLAAWGACN